MNANRTHTIYATSKSLGGLWDKTTKYASEQWDKGVDYAVQKGKEALVDIAQDKLGDGAADITRATLGMKLSETLKKRPSLPINKVPNNLSIRSMTAQVLLFPNAQSPRYTIANTQEFNDTNATPTTPTAAASSLSIPSSAFVKYVRVVQNTIANKLFQLAGTNQFNSLNDFLKSAFAQFKSVTSINVLLEGERRSRTYYRRDVLPKTRPNQLSFMYDGDSPTKQLKTDIEYYKYIVSRLPEIKTALLRLAPNWNTQTLTPAQASQLAQALGAMFGVNVAVFNSHGNSFYKEKRGNLILKSPSKPSQLPSTSPKPSQLPSTSRDSREFDDEDIHSGATIPTEGQGQTPQPAAKTTEEPIPQKPFYKKPAGIALISTGVIGVGVLGYLALKD